MKTTIPIFLLLTIVFGEVNAQSGFDQKTSTIKYIAVGSSLSAGVRDGGKYNYNYKIVTKSNKETEIVYCRFTMNGHTITKRIVVNN